MKAQAINLKKVKVRYKKLGRERAWGQYYYDRGKDNIDLDPRMNEKKFLIVAAHEISHAVFPDMVESDIERLSNGIGKFLWSLGFRRVILDKKKRKNNIIS